MSILDTVADIRVEIGFGVNAVGGDFLVLDDPVKGLLDDGAGTHNDTYGLAPDTVFVDVTEHVAAISTDRGRERELDEYGTGVATVVFNDDDRTFDPAHVLTSGHVDFPGTNGNYLSAPSTSVGGTDVLTIVCRVRATNWAVTGNAAVVAEWLDPVVSPNRSFFLQANNGGSFAVVWSTTGNDALAISSPAHGFVNGEWQWMALTFDPDNGSSQRELRLLESDDGTTWAQVGATTTTAGATTIFDSASLLNIGARSGGAANNFDADISHVSILTGGDPTDPTTGTEVFRFDGETDLFVDPDAGEIEAATGQTITVNRSGSPTTTIVPATGQFAGEIVPMKRIEITWRDDPLFTGWVDDWSVVYEPGDRLSRVTATCVDGFAILANQELTEIGAAHSGDLSGVRIRRVLNRAEVDYPASRSIDDGNSTLGATTFGQNALSYLQACSVAEAGYLFVAADGTLTFRDRLSILNVPSGATFFDEGDVGIRYMNVTQRSSADLLFTRVTGESETTGNEVMASDADAAAKFLIRNLDLGTLFTIDDDETQGLVDFHLERFKEPEVRFQTATVNTGALADGAAQTLVSLDLIDVVFVSRMPLGIGTITRRSIIDGIRHNISPGSWTTDVSFANADTRLFLTLDDPVFGALDANRLAF